MILAFSGTGNSLYVAEELEKLCGGPLINLNTSLKQGITPEVSGGPVIVVAPTYAWQLPHVVKDLLQEIHFDKGQEIYFVLTCGSEIGNAGKYLAKFCLDKELNYMGVAEIIMPENLLALFETPSDEKALTIIKEAKSVIERVAKNINAGEPFPTSSISILDRIYSGPVNSIFYSLIVKPSKFKVKPSCISCRICEQVCPLNNIKLEHGRPEWGADCTYCMACIANCPVEAIECRSSKGRNRYIFPESPKQNKTKH